MCLLALSIPNLAQANAPMPNMAHIFDDNYFKSPVPHTIDQTPYARDRLLLHPTINGTETPADMVMTMARLPDGSWLARAGDLRSLRLKIDSAIGSDTMVHLGALSGVHANYDAESQSIALQAPDTMITPYQLDLGGTRRKVNPEDIQPTTSLVLNYGVYNTYASNKLGTSGRMEAMLMTPAGIFSTSAQAWLHSPSYGDRLVRLETGWRYLDDRRTLSYALGDFTSNALRWTTSLRLAGLQISSAFRQRGDLVTTALPDFSGTAALPSTVDLYVNQQRVFSGEVPSGPYTLNQLPITASGQMRLVATTTTGRQIEISKPFYYIPNQMRRGLTEFSLDIGVPRLNYNTTSFDYDKVILASGSIRHGVGHGVSLEGHTEASSDGLVLAGGGAVLALGGYGAFTGSLAASSYQGHSGGQYSARLEGRLFDIQAYASTQRNFGTYLDLARVGAYRQALRSRSINGPYSDMLTAQASAIDTAGFSFTPRFDKTSFNFAYNRIVTSGSTYEALNLSLTRALGSRISALFNGFVNLDRRDSFGLFVTLAIKASERVEATTSYSQDAASRSYTLRLARNSSGAMGDHAWTAELRQNSNGQTDGRIAGTYYAPDAVVRAASDYVNGQWRGTLDAEGSIIIAGGRAFAANHIADGFVIVRGAGSHSDIRLGGQPVARTDKAGYALLPNVAPYQWHQIYINPTNMDDGWDLPSTQQEVAVGYRRGAIVDFGAKFSRSAIVILVDRKGELIAPGHTVQIEGGGSVVTGYDGKVYLQDLKASNRLEVDLGEERKCVARFDYAATAGLPPTIGPLTCT